MLKQLFSKHPLNNKDQTSDVKLNVEADVKSVALPDRDESSASEAVPVLETASNKKRSYKLATIPKGKVAASLGILGAVTGLSFTQVAPTDLQAVVLPEQFIIQAPLRHANDPAIEPFVISTRDLFLIHQIFYRKGEALTHLSGSVGGASTQVTTPAEAIIPANQSSREGKTSAADSQASDVETTQQADRVAMAAPPAPKVEQPVFTGATIDNVLEMRVAVAKDVETIAFTTSEGGTIADLEGNALKVLSAETTAYAEIGDGVVVDGETLPSAFWVYPEAGSYVAVGNSWYRGRVLIALRERGLIAVNHVLLGDYLYSVVGSEMFAGWAIESLKAQAVAARSYALTHNIHPASEAYFDLDNTQRFQAYKGIDWEASSTQMAVQATAGEFISYEGGIVESLYAASQAIVDDAHSGSGMSQLGAKDLAEQGYDYTAILAHYYPGTGLGRIETDAE